jgi:hypothetical protein
MFSRLAAMVNSDDPRNAEHRFLIRHRSEPARRMEVSKDGCSRQPRRELCAHVTLGINELSGLGMTGSQSRRDASQGREAGASFVERTRGGRVGAIVSVNGGEPSKDDKPIRVRTFGWAGLSRRAVSPMMPSVSPVVIKVL